MKNRPRYCPTRQLRGIGRRSREDALNRIQADTSNAFRETFDESALAAAAGIDRRIAEGEPGGPLAGVPVAIKDNICTRARANQLRFENARRLPLSFRRHRRNQIAGSRGRCCRQGELR